MSGPLSFGLSLRDSTLIIIFFGLSTGTCVPYFSRWGPMLGLRTMVHARYSYGYDSSPFFPNAPLFPGSFVTNMATGSTGVSSPSY